MGYHSSSMQLFSRRSLQSISLCCTNTGLENLSLHKLRLQRQCVLAFRQIAGFFTLCILRATQSLLLYDTYWRLVRISSALNCSVVSVIVLLWFRFVWRLLHHEVTCLWRSLVRVTHWKWYSSWLHSQFMFGFVIAVTTELTVRVPAVSFLSATINCSNQNVRTMWRFGMEVLKMLNHGACIFEIAIGLGWHEVWTFSFQNSYAKVITFVSWAAVTQLYGIKYRRICRGTIEFNHFDTSVMLVRYLIADHTMQQFDQSFGPTQRHGL